MIRFGIMGAGGISKHFCNAVSLIDGASVVAVASKSEERAERFAEANGIEAGYGSYEEMLKREDIDAVYIGTTINYHYDHIKACLEQNKHVLCEKCMVRTSREAEELFALARQKRLFLMEGMWIIFLPKIQKAKQWIQEGKIGTVKLAQATLGFPAAPDPDSRLFNPDLGGGSLFDLGVYPIEMFGYLFDREVTNSQSKVLYASTGVDETVNLNLEYGEILANVQCSFSTVLPEDAYIYGDNGYIHLKKMHIGNSARLYDKSGTLVEEFASEHSNGFEFQIRETMACIRSGKLQSDIASHRLTLESNKVFDACLRTD